MQLTPTQVKTLAVLAEKTTYNDRSISASFVARSLWPDEFYEHARGRNQKAGTILTRLDRMGLAYEGEYGWTITAKGLEALRAAKGEGDE